MSLKDFLIDIDSQVSTVLDSSFKIEITDTDYVPNFDDSAITYDNLDQKTKKCKRLESCVLYVDMRDSTAISAEKRPHTLAKIYSSFVKSMIACARYYGGHVRNIIGDRVMVVFDKEDCFKKAIDTAILMNSVNRFILNKRIKDVDFKCGIGIDHGKMLIAKAGAIRQGSETEFYRSLVWLGNPANVASKLTDVANKPILNTLPYIHQGNYYPLTKKWAWFDQSYEEFIENLEVTYSRDLRHKDEYFRAFCKILRPKYTHPSPILMTQTVYDGFKKAYPADKSIQGNFWQNQSLSVKGYDGNVLGGDVFWEIAKEI
jgi:adenylate cyclase